MQDCKRATYCQLHGPRQGRRQLLAAQLTVLCQHGLAVEPPAWGRQRQSHSSSGRQGVCVSTSGCEKACRALCHKLRCQSGKTAALGLCAGDGVQRQADAPPLGSVCSVQTLQGLHNLYASGLGPICHVPCIPIVIYNDITMLMCESRLAHADVHDKVLFQAATGQPACLRLPLCSVRPAHADMPGKASWPRIAINSTDASGRSQDMQHYYFVLIQRRG